MKNLKQLLKSGKILEAKILILNNMDSIEENIDTILGEIHNHQNADNFVNFINEVTEEGHSYQNRILSDFGGPSWISEKITEAMDASPGIEFPVNPETAELKIGGEKINPMNPGMSFNDHRHIHQGNTGKCTGAPLSDEAKKDLDDQFINGSGKSSPKGFLDLADEGSDAFKESLEVDIDSDKKEVKLELREYQKQSLGISNEGGYIVPKHISDEIQRSLWNCEVTTGHRLNNVGNIHDLPRKYAESDESFRERLINHIRG